MSGSSWMTLIPKSTLLFVYYRESICGYLKPDDMHLKQDDMEVYTIMLN